MAAPALVERAKLRVGSVLREKWTLDSLLGVGGSAAVYSATHRNGKRAAIKLLHQELSVEPDVVARFLREGYVANKIDHPGAVAIIDDDKTDDGAVFLIMELLHGQTLERKLRKEGARPVQEALRLTEELLEVLQTAHEKGIIHRDIKPANIFLTKQGPVKVLDYGIARLAETSTLVNATLAGMPLGTPAFMPPEQARGRWDVVDARTDVWAVGAVLWAMLVGYRPRKAETSNEELLLAMTEPIPAILTVAPHVSADVAKLVDRAVAFDMAARWPSARTMQQAARLALLLEQASGRDSSSTPAPPRVDIARLINPTSRQPPRDADLATAQLDTMTDNIRPSSFTPSDAALSAEPQSIHDAVRPSTRVPALNSSLTPSGIHADGILTTGRPLTASALAADKPRPRGRKIGYFALAAILALGVLGATYGQKYLPQSVARPAPPVHPVDFPRDQNEVKSGPLPPPIVPPTASSVPSVVKPLPPATGASTLPAVPSAAPSASTKLAAPSTSTRSSKPKPPPSPAAAPPPAEDKFGF
jgi:serine/threonine protein kinase